VKLGKGIFYDESFFASDVEVREYDGIKSCVEKIKGLDDIEQFQLYKEALAWMEYRGNEIDEFYFKAQQMSIQ